MCVCVFVCLIDLFVFFNSFVFWGGFCGGFFWVFLVFFLLWIPLSVSFFS